MRGATTIWRDVQGVCEQTGCWAMLTVEFERAEGATDGADDRAISASCKTRKPGCDTHAADCLAACAISH